MITFTSIIECDLCGLTHIETVDGDFYYDYCISPPVGWNSDLLVPMEYREHETQNIADACFHCKDSPDWEAYKRRWQERST